MPDGFPVAPNGFLLDTCVFSAAHSPRHQHHQVASDFLQKGPPANGIPTFLSVVNLMELDFGIRLLRIRDGLARPDFEALLEAVQGYSPRPVERFVVDAYSDIRVRLAMHFLPKKIREQKKLGEVERWRSDLKNEYLGVEEGDLWLAAQAVVFDVTLVTLEQQFVRFQEVKHPALNVHIL